MTGSNPRILIVDDEVDLLDEVASYFRRRGEDVSTATCVAEGRSILEAASPPIDVLISDGRMPDGSGIELIRRQLARGDCLCFLMTGHLDQSQIAADLEGVRIFFKPFAISKLHREVRSSLAAGADASTAPRPALAS